MLGIRPSAAPRSVGHSGSVLAGGGLSRELRRGREALARLDAVAKAFDKALPRHVERAPTLLVFGCCPRHRFRCGGHRDAQVGPGQPLRLPPPPRPHRICALARGALLRRRSKGPARSAPTSHGLSGSASSSKGGNEAFETSRQDPKSSGQRRAGGFNGCRPLWRGQA